MLTIDIKRRLTHPVIVMPQKCRSSFLLDELIIDRVRAEHHTQFERQINDRSMLSLVCVTSIFIVEQTDAQQCSLNGPSAAA
jgi:hypothetical protein